MKLTKGTIIGALAIAAVLVGLFLWGGNAPGLQGQAAAQPSTGVTLPVSTPAVTPSLTPAPMDTQTALPTETPLAEAPSQPGQSPTPSHQVTPPPAQKDDTPPSAGQEMVIDESTGKDQYLTDPVPEGKPLPVEPQDVTMSDTAYTCTLSVRCDTILDNMDWLDPEKAEMVPEDGVIFPTATVTFYEGESVFHVLQREMKKAKIHMEFSNTPIYNSAYIEGIHNLYEFDCGELSGWMYKVNDWFPNYGCSRYQLKQDDVIEWVYTCDLGADVGRTTTAGG